MALPLSGRTAIVTGSSRGIGRAIAIHLASLGANIVVNYASSSTQAALLVSQLNSNSSTLRAISVQADIADPSTAKLLFDKAEQAFNSPVHIFVNAAAIAISKNPTISSTALEDFDAIFSANVRGAFLCCKEASNRIVRGGGGRIVMFSTSLVRMLKPNIGVYTATKAAVETLTTILAKELKGTRITANCVAPGPIKTDMFLTGRSEEVVRMAAEVNTMGRLGEPEDVAPVVGFLCKDEAEWVNGQVIRVNAGIC